MSLREVNSDDMLRNWIDYREEDICSTTDKDKRHGVFFEDITKEIIDYLPKDYQAFVQKKLDKLDDNYLDYLGYWNEKYYRYGFCDGIELVTGCQNK